METDSDPQSLFFVRFRGFISNPRIKPLSVVKNLYISEQIRLCFFPRPVFLPSINALRETVGRKRHGYSSSEGLLKGALFLRCLEEKNACNGIWCVYYSSLEEKYSSLDDAWNRRTPNKGTAGDTDAKKAIRGRKYSCSGDQARKFVHYS